MLPVKSRARINSRRKGAVFERRVALFLSEKLGGKIERNLGQSRRAGTDLVSAPGSSFSIDGWAIECKTANSSSIPTWWRQTLANCGPGQKPALVFKVRRRAPLWLFRVVDVPIGIGNGATKAYDFNDPVMALSVAEALEVLKSTSGLTNQR